MPRADAQRNIDALLAAAKAEFLTNGVDVSVRAIAARADVGTATLYRHFPTRADLISAVFHKAIDALTEAADDLAAAYPPDAALERWVHGYIDFVATKHGLAGALYSGDPAFNGLREHFETRIGPTLQRLLDEAEHVRAIRPGIDPLDLLGAVANLCIPSSDSTDTSRAYRMVALLLDGLRYGAASRPSASA